MPANGSAPTKMSFSEMSCSARVERMAKITRPNGGVTSPISTPMTVMTPNQIRSTCMASSVGSTSGSTISMIETESTTVPSTSSTAM